MTRFGRGGNPQRQTEFQREAMAIIAFCVIFNLFSRGAVETFAVFILPVTNDLGWQRGEFSSVYAVYQVAHGLSAPFIGALFDRFGGRVVYFIGAFCYGSAYYLGSQMQTLTEAYIGLGIVMGIGVAGIGMAPASAILSRWFDKKIGTAMGLSYAGLAVGVIVLAPLNQWLIDTNGWRATYLVMAFAFFVIACIILFLPWRRIEMGSNSILQNARSKTLFPGRDLIFTRAFLGLFGTFFCAAVAIYSVIVQLVAYLVEHGIAPLAAATAFGSINALSVIAIIVTGWLADRFSRKYIISVSYSLTIASILVLWQFSTTPSFLLLCLFVLLLGASMGARGPIVSTLTARLFPGSVGAVYGAATVGLGLGAAFGSSAAGWLYDATGDYRAAFVVSIAASLVGIFQFWFIPELATGKWQEIEQT